MEAGDEMNATIEGTSCIFDYFQLSGRHMPLIQFIAGYCMQVKHWSFSDMIKVGFASVDGQSNWARCTFYFQNGRREQFIVAQDERHQFFVKEEQ